MVERVAWDDEAAGSRPVTPTIYVQMLLGLVDKGMASLSGRACKFESYTAHERYVLTFIV